MHGMCVSERASREYYGAERKEERESKNVGEWRARETRKKKDAHLVERGAHLLLTEVVVDVADVDPPAIGGLAALVNLHI